MDDMGFTLQENRTVMEALAKRNAFGCILDPEQHAVLYCMFRLRLNNLEVTRTNLQAQVMLYLDIATFKTANTKIERTIDLRLATAPRSQGNESTKLHFMTTWAVTAYGQLALWHELIDRVIAAQRAGRDDLGAGRRAVEEAADLDETVKATFLRDIYFDVRGAKERAAFEEHHNAKLLEIDRQRGKPPALGDAANTDAKPIRPAKRRRQ